MFPSSQLDADHRLREFKAYLGDNEGCSMEGLGAAEQREMGRPREIVAVGLVFFAYCQQPICRRS